MPRTKPYTERGIRRLPCFRCGRKPSYSQWQVCALNNEYLALCMECDIELNIEVLVFMNKHDRLPNCRQIGANYEVRTRLS